MSTEQELAQACQTGQPVRIHTADGEVLVARVLAVDAQEVVVQVLTSSRPERHAYCDSTGVALPHTRIERVRLLREPRGSSMR